MSGPKRAKAELDPQRAEILRLQREYEERVRHARELQQRDQQRQRAAQQSMENIQTTLDLARDIVNSRRSASIDQYTAEALQQWEHSLQAARQEFDHLKMALSAAEQQFTAASAAWQANPEIYQGGHFQQLDFSKLRRLAETLQAQGKKIVQQAEAQRETERLRQQLEQQRVGLRVRAGAELIAQTIAAGLSWLWQCGGNPS